MKQIRLLILLIGTMFLGNLLTAAEAGPAAQPAATKIQAAFRARAAARAAARVQAGATQLQTLTDNFGRTQKAIAASSQTLKQNISRIKAITTQVKGLQTSVETYKKNQEAAQKHAVEGFVALVGQYDTALQAQKTLTDEQSSIITTQIADSEASIKAIQDAIKPPAAARVVAAPAPAAQPVAAPGAGDAVPAAAPAAVVPVAEAPAAVVPVAQDVPAPAVVEAAEAPAAPTRGRGAVGLGMAADREGKNTGPTAQNNPRSYRRKA